MGNEVKNMSGVSEEEMADIIFSLNKKAKNLRDEQREITYKKKKKITKSNKGKVQKEVASLKEQKNEYYEQKDLLLTTYFEPVCIHKQHLEIKQYEYISNMKDVDLEKLMGKNFGMYFHSNFLEMKFQKKMKMVEVNGEMARTNCYCFNDIITNEHTKERILADIDCKLNGLIFVKGSRIYIPYFAKPKTYEKLDCIFAKYLWDGRKIEKPKGFKKIMEFGNVKIAKKTIIVDSLDKYYLLYKVDDHSFHKPIEKCELENYNQLEIIDVLLDTKGEDVQDLVEDDLISKELEKLKDLN